MITTTTLRDNLSHVVSQVENKKDYLLVLKRGKIKTAIVNIDLFEDLLALADKKYLNSIKQARLQYKNGDFLTHDQVFGNL